jgi:uncharacterized repeat protein (TIGR03806 family)
VNVSSRVLLLVALVGCTQATPPEPFENGCVAPARPPLGHTVDLVRVFDAIQLDDSVDLLRAPGDDDHLYVVVRSGEVWRFAARGDGEDLTQVIDLTEQVSADDPEAGLLGMAFHPDFESNGFVYLSYNTPGPGAFLSRVSRFESTDQGATFERDSESVVLEVSQPAANHNGGDIDFGPDGMLYIAFGDGGGGGDTFENGQDTNTLLGAILRIDVDSAEPYASPADNPFANGGGAPEIFAWGLRNPWRMAFDSDSDQLWAGDVGQHLWEEVNRIERGGNYGWNLREGAHCFMRTQCDLDQAVEPIAEFRNPNNASVIGGQVYRGEAIPNLNGHFVYSDYYLGTVWAVREGEAPRVLHEAGGRNVSSWGTDAAGELLALGIDGRIHRVVAASPEQDQFPSKLSETGCVDMQDPASPAEGLVAYDVHVPLWSDGASKERFVALPDGARIEVGDDGDWDLPAGSVLVKNFRLGDRLVETRLLMRHREGGWAGYSYEWDGDDAVLLTKAETRDFDGQSWHFPSRSQCSFCHTTAAGGSLGLESGQVSASAVETLLDLGALSEAPSDAALPALVSDAPLDERVRAYLHVNCSNCHRPDAPNGRADLDLRFDTALSDTGLIDAPPLADWAGPSDQRLLVPGDPDRSILLLRMQSTDQDRMPSLASDVVDEEAVTAVQAWIEQLPAQP